MSATDHALYSPFLTAPSSTGTRMLQTLQSTSLEMSMASTGHFGYLSAIMAPCESSTAHFHAGMSQLSTTKRKVRHQDQQSEPPELELTSWRKIGMFGSGNCGDMSPTRLVQELKVSVRSTAQKSHHSLICMLATIRAAIRRPITPLRPLHTSFIHQKAFKMPNETAASVNAPSELAQPVNRTAHAFDKAQLDAMLLRRFFFAPSFEIYGGTYKISKSFDKEADTQL